MIECAEKGEIGEYKQLMESMKEARDELER